MTSSWPELKGRVVGIWGLGEEGRSMVKAASAADACRIEAVDDAAHGHVHNADGTPNLTIWRGPAHLNRLRACDIVFVSPAIPWHHPFFVELRRAGMRISNAADWFLSQNSARTIGVTGTKGKSTTASFLSHLLNQLGGDTVVAGNMGPLLSDLELERGQVVVAELSSQQCALLTASPVIAVITSLYEEHLDWHGDVAGYYTAKAKVFLHGARSLVCTSHVVEALKQTGITSFPPSLLIADDASWQLDGVVPVENTAMTYEHNVINTRLAVLASTEFTGREVTPEELHRAMLTFAPLPHRLQLVKDDGRRRWIDDTLATTGESVVAALRAIKPSDNIALIVGGLHRNLNYQQLDDYLAGGARTVSLIQSPTNGTEIGRRYAELHPDRVYRARSLKDAVQIAASLQGVDVVLLSPGAASYDLYPNFEAKAAAFRRYIDSL